MDRVNKYNMSTNHLMFSWLSRSPFNKWLFNFVCKSKVSLHFDSFSLFQISNKHKGTAMLNTKKITCPISKQTRGEESWDKSIAVAVPLIPIERIKLMMAVISIFLCLNLIATKMDKIQTPKRPSATTESQNESTQFLGMRYQTQRSPTKMKMQRIWRQAKQMTLFLFLLFWFLQMIFSALIFLALSFSLFGVSNILHPLIYIVTATVSNIKSTNLIYSDPLLFYFSTFCPSISSSDSIQVSNSHRFGY